MVNTINTRILYSSYFSVRSSELTNISSKFTLHNRKQAELVSVLSVHLNSLEWFHRSKQYAIVSKSFKKTIYNMNSALLIESWYKYAKVTKSSNQYMYMI